MKYLALILMLWSGAAFAVEPNEMLDDPVLEARARALSAGLRCPVCQNESIDESDAILSRDLRIILRERLTAGDTDAQAVDYLVARYGEFVLLRPTADGANLVLWLAAPAMLLVAGLIGWATIRRKPAMPDTLDDDEKAALEKILRS